MNTVHEPVTQLRTMPEPGDHVDFSRFKMGSLIPLNGFWFKVAGRDGNKLVLQYQGESKAMMKRKNKQTGGLYGKTN